MAEIQRLKGVAGKNINVTGSAKLVQSLLRENLLDELRLLVHPIVVGGGSGCWKVIPARIRCGWWTQTFDTGVLYLTYQPADRWAEHNAEERDLNEARSWPAWRRPAIRTSI